MKISQTQVAILIDFVNRICAAPNFSPDEISRKQMNDILHTIKFQQSDELIELDKELE